MKISKGLRLIRSLLLHRQWRRLPTSYRRLESVRSPAPATKLLRWVFSPRLCVGEEEEPSLAPKGHLVVYVGGGEKYFVPVLYCNHPLFGELLKEAEEEFGFYHPAGITIPCPAVQFEKVTKRIAGGASVGDVDRRSFQA